MGTKQLQLDSLLQETSPQDIYHAVCHLGSLYSCLHASGRCSSASSHAWFCLATSFEASNGPVYVDDDDADGPGKRGQQHDATHDDDDDGRTRWRHARWYNASHDDDDDEQGEVQG